MKKQQREQTNKTLNRKRWSRDRNLKNIWKWVVFVSQPGVKYSLNLLRSRPNSTDSHRPSSGK